MNFISDLFSVSFLVLVTDYNPDVNHKFPPVMLNIRHRKFPVEGCAHAVLICARCFSLHFMLLWVDSCDHSKPYFASVFERRRNVCILLEV